MHVDEADTGVLKKWVVKRLEDISDADSDVLADYVLALVKSEESDEKVKSNCLENLEDFLREHTAEFVEDVFDAIRTKSYSPTYSAARSALSPTAAVFKPPVGPSFNPSSTQSRKRTFNDHEGNESRDGRDSHYSRGAAGARPAKHMRRGGGRSGASEGRRQGFGAGRDGALPDLGPLSMAAMAGMPGMPGMPPMPTPPPGFPPLDPNNPLSAIMAMQAMGFPPLPGFPPLAPAGSPTSASHVAGGNTSQREPPPKRVGERCKDYDTKGFCALGSACPYEHGPDLIVIPGQSDEYDPNNAILDNVKSPNGQATAEPRRNGDRGRGRGRGRMQSDRGGHPSGRTNRAPFSHVGPNNDRSITTIVVEQIPEEKFDEESVRDFFNQFGNIEEVTMQPYKRLAIVKFDHYSSARRAYESPKVIFDNRFVKVYWYKPDSVPKPPINGAGNASSPTPAKSTEEEMIDVAEIERMQAEAQKAHEEKARKLKEAESKREELEKKMKAQAEERKKLLEKLAAKSGSKTATATTGDATADAATNGSATERKNSSQTEALKAKLAELEAEAESIGLNPDEPYAGYGRGRGRGGYRARGGFAPRGRGFDPYRGSFRGRGSFFGAPGIGRGGAVKRLDNRPKKVAVSGVEFGTTKDEALRQYLFNNFEFESIDPHPERKDSQIVTFKERYVAENFIAQSSDIPSIGHVELSWVTTPATSSNPQPTQPATPKATDTVMGNGTAPPAEAPRQTADVDYDVADDDDRWMAVG